MTRLQDRAVVWWTLALCVVLVEAADIVTTIAFLGAGGSEWSPLAAYLLSRGGLGLLIWAKLALALALWILLIAFAARRKARRSAAGGVALLAVVGLLVVMWLIIGRNLAVWLILAHALPWR